MEDKSQQKFYYKAAIIVISSKLSLWSIHFQALVQKVTKWLIIIHYFRFMLCISFILSNNKVLGTFSSLNLLGACVQDMQSCPTHAVESSKIHNGFDMSGSWFKTRQLSLPHTCSIGFKSEQARRWKTSDVQLIFVFLDIASTVGSCNVISEHHVLAI